MENINGISLIYSGYSMGNLMTTPLAVTIRSSSITMDWTSSMLNLSTALLPRFSSMWNDTLCSPLNGYVYNVYLRLV